ncbi:MAG: hypothetical protein HY707_06115 [Ignavibacteriae bacterium]|nr:hypothetical protein [Ignavibacteriota bacterium]
MKLIVKDLTGQTRLWFGEKGIELRTRILAEVKKEKETKLLRVDLQGIEVTDTSYAREAFVNLVGLIGTEVERPQILFANVKQHVKENMHLSFKEHKKFTLITDEDGEWNLIGKFSEQLSETVKVLVQMKEARATEIKKKLKEEVELSALNNRLANLHEMCVVHRSAGAHDSGGIEYTYTLQL